MDGRMHIRKQTSAKRPKKRVYSVTPRLVEATTQARGKDSSCRPVSSDLETLGLVSQTVSDCNVLKLSTGGFLGFYRAMRQSYDPRSLIVTHALSIDTIMEQLQAMGITNEKSESTPYLVSGGHRFDANVDKPGSTASIPFSWIGKTPCGLFVCTDAIETHQVDAYALLFATFYRDANPMFKESTAPTSVDISPSSLSANASVAPTPTPQLLHSTAVAEGPAKSIVSGLRGSQKALNVSGWRVHSVVFIFAPATRYGKLQRMLLKDIQRLTL
ncbi:hypothetical protein PsorP6_006955 [Peronosclerospora sorghi]|uniref:Uncharacterized protein n=1 Tax=Peronosclerospora sorghi TaxID=230839 RepID=A0ACC0W906_9STRA|nr:hypothetical protein PsorP6_006955 [Peronosclerospora sorghi]